MALTHHTGIPRPLNAGCSPRVIISVSNNPFCLGSSVTFTPTITCLETAQIAAYGWIVNGTIVSTSGDPYTTTELTNNDSVYLLVIGTNGISYFSNVIYMIVTSEGCITEIKYGLLYNWYAATDVRKITSSDTWVVPTMEIAEGLRPYIDPTGNDWVNIAGGKLKEIGDTHWNGNVGATNDYNFNARGCGYRQTGGIFNGLKQTFRLTTSTIPMYSNDLDYKYVNASDVTFSINSTSKIAGGPYRLYRDATVDEILYCNDGDACAPYTGNDGKNYRTVKIGTQVWLADNLAETKFRNGDYLHGYEGGSYQAISNAAWAALESEGVCCYDNDINLI